jgi:hypothetical protein
VQCTTAALGRAGDVVLHAHAATSDPNPSNSDSSRTVHMIAGGADVEVEVYAPDIDPGLPFDAAVFIDNHGAIAATGVTATLTFPALVRVVSLPDNCQQSGQTVTCSSADLPARLGQTIFNIRLVADDLLNGETIPISADVHTSAPEGNVSNNHFSLSARVFREFYVTEATGNALAGAIGQANVSCTDVYPCKIGFRLSKPPAEGYFTIKPAEALPKITASTLSIDGSTQTRLTGDTNPNGPEIFIDGSAIAGDGIAFDSPCKLEVSSLGIGHFGQAAIAIVRTSRAACPDGIGGSVHDNYLGVDPTGLHAAPNGRGVVANDIYYLVIEKNIISGNVRSGIWMGTTPYAFIRNNTIGLDRQLQPLGNGASGIYVGPTASDHDIRGNYIAFNHDFGVAVDRKARGTYIGPNSIFANSQLGIDVGLDGPTPDRDVPAPTVLSAQYDAATNTTLLTIASSEPLIISQPTLHIYASDAPHPSGYGDGQYYLGTTRFDSRRGNIHFAALGDWRGKWVSATVTRNEYYGYLRTVPAGPDSEDLTTHSTTSEFSRAVKVE